MIGATTLDEYRKYVEKDPALERRFQPVLVDEPSVEETISILRGLKERYEVHHGVRITDPAVIAAATLSTPLHHRPAPAGQGHRPDRRGRRPPAHRDRLQAAGAGRGRPADHAARDRAPGAARRKRTRPPKSAWRSWRRSWPTCSERSSQLHARWQTEKEAIASLRTTKEQIEQTRLEMERAERQNNYEAAARLRYGTLRELEKKLAESEARMKDAASGGRAAQRRSGRRGDRPDRLALDRHPGLAPAGRRDGEADAHGRAPARARGRAGRGAAGGLQRRAPRRAPACRTPTARSARSSSWARPASARPSWRAPWRSSCSTTSAP